jgi:hypothetical protein
VPYENVAETEALDKYERLHGTLTVDTVDAAGGFASAANVYLVLRFVGGYQTRESGECASWFG